MWGAPPWGGLPSFFFGRTNGAARALRSAFAAGQRAGRARDLRPDVVREVDDLRAAASKTASLRFENEIFQLQK